MCVLEEKGENSMRNTIRIESDRYIYRCTHITMEATCAVDHGPRAVDVGPLDVDVYPVTNANYALFLSATGYSARERRSYLRHWIDSKLPPGMEELPVVWVSLEDARAYASWAGGRLPTDEEWQYIAAGQAGRKWPWGEEFDARRCNHDGPGLSNVDAHPNGASWCGCNDLSGNAWEWTDTTIDDGMHVFALIRGGSYFSAPAKWHVPGGAHMCDFHWKLQLLNAGMNRAATLGFRCVYGGGS